MLLPQQKQKIEKSLLRMEMGVYVSVCCTLLPICIIAVIIIIDVEVTVVCIVVFVILV